MQMAMNLFYLDIMKICFVYIMIYNYIVKFSYLPLLSNKQWSFRAAKSLNCTFLLPFMQE